MRSSFFILLFTVILFSGGYLYFVVQAVCPVPLTYRIGEIDERFDIDIDGAKLAVAEAESVWEDSTGRNLFSYDEESDFTINFVFDERQALADAEDDYKERLDKTEGVNDAISEQYADLVSEYNKLQRTYDNRAEVYERALSVYNTKVQKYNSEGGAPPDIFEELEKEKNALDSQQSSLNALADELNAAVKEINRIGSQGNRLIETYNRGVEVYNQTFGESREFTQGDYQGTMINIYTFSDETELELVLAHELGHALHVGHVEGEQSIMYYLIGQQPRDLALSETDILEFDRVCGEKSFWDRIETGIQLLFSN